LKCCSKNATFPPWERAVAKAERTHATTRDKGHGRYEERALTATGALAGYLDWPGARQVFRLERTRTIHGQTSSEVVYGITSLPVEKADATRLLGLTRHHWRIENSLYYVRDVVFGEDACRARKGSTPRFLAAIRNLTITLLARAGVACLASALRRHAARPLEALVLLQAQTEN
jgi:hypothetical protein